MKFEYEALIVEKASGEETSLGCFDTFAEARADIDRVDKLGVITSWRITKDEDDNGNISLVAASAVSVTKGLFLVKRY